MSKFEDSYVKITYLAPQNHGYKNKNTDITLMVIISTKILHFLCPIETKNHSYKNIQYHINDNNNNY